MVKTCGGFLRRLWLLCVAVATQSHAQGWYIGIQAGDNAFLDFLAFLFG